MKLLRICASFRGRIGRAHFWLLVIVSAVIVVLAAIIGSTNLGSALVQWFAYTLLIISCVPVASATFRRLHDINLSRVQIIAFLIVSGLLQILAFLAAKWSPTLGAIATLVLGTVFVALGVVRGTSGSN